MASITRRSYGHRDLKLGELRNFRVHLYSTTAALDADVATAEARIAYVLANNCFFFGKPGSWIQLGASSPFADTVDTPGDLPTSADTPAPIDGQVRVVLDDGTNGFPAIWQYDIDTDSWSRVADPRIVLKDGSVEFDGIPAVVDATVQVPTANKHLTTKKYADDQDAATLAAANAAATAADAAHVAAPDPHPQYTTAAEAAAADSAAIAAHEAALDPHPAYETAAEVNAKIASHDSNPGAHGGLVTAADISNAIATHDAEANAHGGVSESGFARMEEVFVVTGAHGSPAYSDAGPFSEIFELSTSLLEPVGVIWKPSTKTTVPSGTVTFSAVGNLITVPDSSVAAIGQLVTFPGAVTNAGVYFRVIDIPSATTWEVESTPANEGPIATTTEVFDKDGIVVFSGVFSIDSAQANNFATSPLPGTGQIAFYVDSTDPKGYSQTAGTFRLGHQITDAEFIVRIARVDAHKTATKTAAGSLTRQLVQLVPVDSTGGAFALTLFTGQEGDVVRVVDVAGQCGANNVTITPAGGQLIDGAATKVLATNYQSARLTLVNGNWFSL